MPGMTKRLRSVTPLMRRGERRPSSEGAAEDGSATGGGRRERPLVAQVLPIAPAGRIVPVRAEPGRRRDLEGGVHEQAADDERPGAVALLEPVDIAAGADADRPSLRHQHEEVNVAFGMGDVAVDLAIVAGNAVMGDEEGRLALDGEGNEGVAAADEGPVLIDGVGMVGGADQIGIEAVESAPVGIDAIEDRLPVAKVAHLRPQFIHAALQIDHPDSQPSGPFQRAGSGKPHAGLARPAFTSAKQRRRWKRSGDACGFALPPASGTKRDWETEDNSAPAPGEEI